MKTADLLFAAFNCTKIIGAFVKHDFQQRDALKNFLKLHG
jgi:hypothetical protein